jgi:hypothetical protein
LEYKVGTTRNGIIVGYIAIVPVTPAGIAHSYFACASKKRKGAEKIAVNDAIAIAVKNIDVIA